MTRLCLAWLTLVSLSSNSLAPAAEPFADVKAEKLFVVTNYCEGVCFDHDGHGYISYGKYIEKFSTDGRHSVWAQTGAPNGHKVLADGTHLVCDGSQHAVLKLSAEGKVIGKASSSSDGKPLRAPNDLTLDVPNGGFYFTDPGGSNLKNLIGTVHYVNSKGETTTVDRGFAFPNGIVLTPDGKQLYLAESQKNRILIYDVTGPGKLENRRLFAELPRADLELGQIDNQPDGMCLDAEGNLYVAHYGMQRVQVLNPQGKLIASLPGGNVTTSNVAFGGPDHTDLYVTGGLGKEVGWGGLFRLDLNRKGLVILPKQK